MGKLKQILTIHSHMVKLEHKLWRDLGIAGLGVAAICGIFIGMDQNMQNNR